MLADDTAPALLANAIATGAILYGIITCLALISGAHFNPAETLAFCLRGESAAGAARAHVACQLVGVLTGVFASHAMFAQQILQLSTTACSGANLWFSEAITAFGLFFVIFGGLRARPDAVPALVRL